MIDYARIKNDLDIAHVKQLSTFSGRTVKTPPVFGIPNPLLKITILQWIKEQKRRGSIDKAKRNRVTTPENQNTPDWNNVMLTIIESTAMYLRRDDDMREAIREAQRGDIETARKHLRDAQVDIDVIANELGLKFIQLCDMAKMKGDKAYSGAFCGMFISDDSEHNFKFAGIAFKGTTPYYGNEWLEDLLRVPIKPDGDILYGNEVHSGFYHGLFDVFGEAQQRPFDLILDGFKLVNDSDHYYFHVTGHSLGAAYATLLHCELTRVVDIKDNRQSIRDIVTFGSPRVGLKPFADKFSGIPYQNSWRIANYEDIITTVPCVDYVHVNIGYTIHRKGSPIPQERDQTPSARVGEDEDDGSTVVGADETLEKKFWRIIRHDYKVYYSRINNIIKKNSLEARL